MATIRETPCEGGLQLDRDIATANARLISAAPDSSFHNMAGRDGRTDYWFTGPDGKNWHGVNIGDMDLVRCHRLKRQ